MSYREEWREELINAMKDLTKEGFKCFIDDQGTWGHIITPSDNVIYIQRDTFEYRGWSTSFEYVPSQKTGKGCQCEEEPFQDITADQILLSEIEGLKYARKLRATFYKSSDEWFNQYWNKNRLIEIN